MESRTCEARFPPKSYTITGNKSTQNKCLGAHLSRSNTDFVLICQQHIHTGEKGTDAELCNAVREGFLLYFQLVLICGKFLYPHYFI